MPDILLRQIPFLKPDEQTIRALVYSVRCVALGGVGAVTTMMVLENVVCGIARTETIL